MYGIWIKIDGTLPWIELKGEYDTKKEAALTSDQVLRKIAVKIVNVSQQKGPLSAMAPIRVSR